MFSTDVAAEADPLEGWLSRRPFGDESNEVVIPVDLLTAEVGGRLPANGFACCADVA